MTEGSSERFYITVAIDYANAEPHVGHAYEKVAADLLARFHRLRGRDVYYLMGNDEHSINVERRARELEMGPKEYSDMMAEVFRGTWGVLGIDYDQFVQTSSAGHMKAVQEFIEKLYQKGYMYSGTYTGWYCVSCEAFYNEDDLEDGHCPVHGRPAEYIEEDNYFFKLSAFAERLQRHIEQNPEFIQPETRRNEMLGILREGLQDVSMSRGKSRWGVPIPWDSEHVVYVWFDALLSYISGIGYGSDQETFERYWPADVHMIGKDITRFHTIIWPAMLMAADLPLPRTVLVHGFLQLEGERMSKTTGNVIDPRQFVEQYGVDTLRYYLLRTAPFGYDGDFTMEGFVRQVNNDLANDLGNLLSRTTAMIERFADGRIPNYHEDVDDFILKNQSEQTRADLARLVESYQLDSALRCIWDLVHAANKYIEDRAPWSLARDADRARELETVLYNLAESLRILAIMLRPILLTAPARIWGQLGLEGIENSTWEDTEWGALTPGTVIDRGDPLFPRLDLPETIEAQKQEETPEKEEDPLLDIKEFNRIDIRVGTVLEAEQVEGADRLLKLLVDVGSEQRQVVTGIAEHYQPQDLLGRSVVVVCNLKPARIFGIESQGMVLTAEDDDNLSVLTVEGKVDPGSPVS